MNELENNADAESVALDAGLGARYVKCINCGHAVSWHAHEHLRVALDCPNCGCKKQFGPGIYVENFQGYTLEEVIQRRSEWLANGGKRVPTIRAPNAALTGAPETKEK